MPTNPNDPTVLSGAPVARAVQRLGRYQLKQRLGVGGMAEVYLAEQDGPQQFKKRVVVKRILPSLASDPSFVAMFVREAQVAARLSHGNVVQIYELGEQPNDDGTVEYFIAMEFIDGLTLQRLATASWRAGRAVPVDVVVRTMADAARGLHAAHTLTGDDGKPLRLVHRDISPDNLMVSRDGVTKVLDFGIAKGDLGGPKTRTGNLRGKVPYMSPEQITGQVLDGRCDLWALGVSTYWLLCGERPFDRGTDFHTMQAVLYDQPKRPTDLNPGIPQPLERLILDLLQKEREARPATGAAVADLLEEMASPGTGAGRRSTVAFVERHLEENAGHGNPLSESGDKTGNTRPLAPSKGDMPSTEVHELPSGERPLTLPAAVSNKPQRIALVDVDGDQAPRKVTMPEEAAAAPAAVPSRDAAAPADATPRTAPPRAGNHPVVDMLAPPRQSSGAGVVVAVLFIGVVVLAAGAFVAWRLVHATPDGKPATADAGAAAPAAAVDAGLSAGAGQAADAGSVVDSGVEPAGDAGSAGAAAASIVVEALGPPRIVWKLDGGRELGRGQVSLAVPAGTGALVAEDPLRAARYTVPILAGKADFQALPAATIVFHQVAGTNIFLFKDYVRDDGAVSVPAGSYMVYMTRGGKTVSMKKLTLAAGQTGLVDAARP